MQIPDVKLFFKVDQLAEGLLSRGLTKGDRLGLWAPNMREWIVTQFAAAQIGFILVCVETLTDSFVQLLTRWSLRR